MAEIDRDGNLVVEEWKTREGDTVEVYTTKDLEYRWRVVAGNGEIVIPPEGHPGKREAVEAARRYCGPVSASETPVITLTAKEWALVRHLLATGCNNSQLAEYLGISLATTGVWLTGIRAKADVETTQQLMSGVLMRRFRFVPEDRA